MRKPLFFLTLVLLSFTLLSAQSRAEGLTGPWEGTLTLLGGELKIIVHLEEGDAGLTGTIDIPQQKAFGRPLTNLRREGENLHFELAAGPGLAVFDGILRERTLQGTFLQAGVKGTFRLLRGEEAPVEKMAVAEPSPYREEEVSLLNQGIRLAGTLTLPQGKGPFPGVIMITGSGAQNRDEEILGFKPFRVIADHLARKGIAVLRCDDRGVGGSGGSTAASTTRDFASDVLAQAAYMRGREEILKEKIGLIGHSEGGSVASLAAQEDHFRFVVLLSGPAVKGEEIVIEQIRLISKAMGLRDEEIRKTLEEQRRVYVLLNSPGGAEELERTVKEGIRESLKTMGPEERRSVSDTEAFVNSYAALQLATLRSPWTRFFLSYDPAQAHERVKCPVLALYGALDLQVSPEQNVSPLREAFKRGGNGDVTIRVIPGGNHLFLQAKTGSPSEYPSLEKVFLPGFLETLSDWILTRVGTP